MSLHSHKFILMKEVLNRLLIRHPSLDENSLGYEGVEIGDGKQSQKRKQKIGGKRTTDVFQMSESISLVVLRLEIETGYSLTTDLNYNGIIIIFNDCLLFKTQPVTLSEPFGLFRWFRNTVLIKEKLIITSLMVIYLMKLFFMNKYERQTVTYLSVRKKN